MLNGNGIRISLWVSGCEHNCNQCQNPQTWDVNSGIPFDKEAEDVLFDELKKDYVLGLTFSGGDPLHSNNLHDVLNLINKIRLSLPNKTIWLYTGYTYEQCLSHPLRREIISKCDVLVDGRYVDKLRDVSLKWVGSSNQRVIDVQKSLENNEVILYEV